MQCCGYNVSVTCSHFSKYYIPYVCHCVHTVETSVGRAWGKFEGRLRPCRRLPQQQPSPASNPYCRVRRPVQRTLQCRPPTLHFNSPLRTHGWIWSAGFKGLMENWHVLVDPSQSQQTARRRGGHVTPSACLPGALQASQAGQQEAAEAARKEDLPPLPGWAVAFVDDVLTGGLRRALRALENVPAPVCYLDKCESLQVLFHSYLRIPEHQRFK